MSKKSEHTFPMGKLDLNGYIEKAWIHGWLDEYSDEHFLIKAIENRVTDIEWKTQLINNNLFSLESPIDQHGRINYNDFSVNFIINLSSRLSVMSKLFGENNIKRFIEDQLSAGKENYDKNTFFQALSEIEILSFYCRCNWCKATYEPPLGINGANPEAGFEMDLLSDDESERTHVKANIEVKTPQFPCINEKRNRIAIPTILLSDK